jgi:hypothetical protein
LPTLELPNSVSRPTVGILSLVEKAVASAPTRVVTQGLPAGSLMFADAQVVASGTPLIIPFFHEAMTNVASSLHADVLLARHGSYPELLDATLWDMAVRLDGNQIQLFTDFVLYSELDNSTWLVPVRAGPFVRLAADGLTLEVEPPFLTWNQRCEGVCRAAKQIIAATRPGLGG